MEVPLQWYQRRKPGFDTQSRRFLAALFSSDVVMPRLEPPRAAFVLQPDEPRAQGRGGH
jgi:hypothetical protein